MISIKSSSNAPEAKANIIPCRIKYTGPASSSRQLWNPTSQTSTDPTPVETHTSYFRGRRLVGTKLVVPDGYQGRVLSSPNSSSAPLTSNQKREVLYQDDDEQSDEADTEESTQWTTSASFSDIMVWGHEMVVDGTQDGVVKGIEEWMGMAQIVSPSHLKADAILNYIVLTSTALKVKWL
ncbi:hypothetical protein TWF679_001479 [Orbilia oligospora]|uniref:Uncharacterized protein n=1 Tax=Orbilia oligospora TaxID=2813651 RepID=A0A8H8VHB5_ORBOL|nr:hypothetical protein TWF679_001479 [Orbilia oligospora]